MFDPKRITLWVAKQMAVYLISGLAGLFLYALVLESGNQMLLGISDDFNIGNRIEMQTICTFLAFLIKCFLERKQKQRISIDYYWIANRLKSK